MAAGVCTLSVKSPIFPFLSIRARSNSFHGRPVSETVVMSSYRITSRCARVCRELNTGYTFIEACGILFLIVVAKPKKSGSPDANTTIGDAASSYCLNTSSSGIVMSIHLWPGGRYSFTSP